MLPKYAGLVYKSPPPKDMAGGGPEIPAPSPKRASLKLVPPLRSTPDWTGALPAHQQRLQEAQGAIEEDPKNKLTVAQLVEYNKNPAFRTKVEAMEKEREMANRMVLKLTNLERHYEQEDQELERHREVELRHIRAAERRGLERDEDNYKGLVQQREYYIKHKKALPAGFDVHLRRAKQELDDNKDYWIRERGKINDKYKQRAADLKSRRRSEEEVASELAEAKEFLDYMTIDKQLQRDAQASVVAPEYPWSPQGKGRNRRDKPSPKG
jgi:hypothetical protein